MACWTCALPAVRAPSHRRADPCAARHLRAIDPPPRLLGSGHGPHKNDIPLRDIVDLVLEVRAGCHSVDAANGRHQYEWEVWREVRLPGGKILMPGVVGHASDVIEHREPVAQGLMRFADLVGRDNVIAGTDCGLGSRVGHPEIAWAKLESLVEGARLASQRLWS